MKRSTLKNLGVLLTAIVVGLVAMEMGVRWLKPQQLVRAYALPDPDLGTYMAPNFTYLDLYGARYLVQTNGMSFRMPDEVDLSPARRRILVYGDSFTFGWGIAYEQTFFAHLKAAAEKKKPAPQLLNAGVGGYSTGHVKKLMDRHLGTIKPSAIIYFFNNNDLIDNAITDVDYRVTAFSVGSDGSVELTDVQPFTAWKRFLLNHTPYSWLNRYSHLFVFSKDLLKRSLNWKPALVMPEVASDARDGDASGSKRSHHSPTAADDKLRPTYTVRLSDDDRSEARLRYFVNISIAHVRRIATLAHASGVPLLIVWIPAEEEMSESRPNTATTRLFTLARSRLAALAQESGQFRFLDTVKSLSREQRSLLTKQQLRFADGHFNVAGNQWFSDHVENGVLRFLDQVQTSERH